MQDKKAARRSCSYGTRQASTRRGDVQSIADYGRAALAAALVLAPTFGACMLHWAVAL